MGLLLAVIITSAAVQDRHGARRVLDRLRFTMPSVALIWADGGYGGPQLLGWARRVLHVSIEIVRKPLGIPTFHVLPRRRVVERTFAWIVKTTASTSGRAHATLSSSTARGSSPTPRVRSRSTSQDSHRVGTCRART